MSAPNWRRNAQLFAAIEKTDTTIGIYAGVNPTTNLHTVNFAESTVEVNSATRYNPPIGEPVILTWINGILRLTGPARAKASEGTIISLQQGGLFGVGTNDNIYNMPADVTVAPNLQVNDAVVIDWDYRRGYIKSKLTAAGIDGDKPPKLTVDQKPFTLNFFAKQSGSKKDGKWWTQDVIADDDNVGGWFYGNVIRKSLKNDAYISSVEIYLPLRSGKGPLPQIGRHSEDTRPSNTGSFSINDAATRGKRSGWVRLPVEWAEGWRDTDGGVGIRQQGSSGTNRYKGIQADRQSGKLRIRGRQ
jgi:hypothetical protein